MRVILENVKCQLKSIGSLRPWGRAQPSGGRGPVCVCDCVLEQAVLLAGRSQGHFFCMLGAAWAPLPPPE